MDIIDVKSGYHYEQLLKAISFIDNTFNGGPTDSAMYKVGPTDIDTITEELIFNIMSRPFKSWQFNEYCQKLMEACYLKWENITINFHQIKNYPVMLNAIFHSDCQWIKLQQLVSVFPKVRAVCVNINKAKVSRMILSKMFNELMQKV
eukprot:324589_1